MESPERPKSLPDLQFMKYVTVMLSLWSWPEQPTYVRVVLTCINSLWKIKKDLIICEPLKSYDPHELADSLLGLIKFYHIEDKIATLVLTNFTSEKDTICIAENKNLILLEELTEILQKRGLNVPCSTDMSKNLKKPIIIIKSDVIRSYLNEEQKLSPSKLASFKKILDFWEGNDKKLESCDDIPEDLIQQIEANRKTSVIDSYPFTWTIPLLIIISKYFLTKSSDPELKAFIKGILSLVDPFYTAMAVLDPRFNHWHDPVEYHNKVMTAVSKAETLCMLDLSPSPDAIQNEFYKYVEETQISKGMTPVMFWQSRQIRYPILAQLAQFFLPISYAVVTENNMFHDKTDVLRNCGGDGDDVYVID